jgi:hypothetical protein
VRRSQDNNGFVDAKDFKDVMESIGIPLTQNEAASMVKVPPLGWTWASPSAEWLPSPSLMPRKWTGMATIA